MVSLGSLFAVGKPTGSRFYRCFHDSSAWLMRQFQAELTEDL
jgi:hypothetical protein